MSTRCRFLVLVPQQEYMIATIQYCILKLQYFMAQLKYFIATTQCCIFQLQCFMAQLKYFIATIQCCARQLQVVLHTKIPQAFKDNAMCCSKECLRYLWSPKWLLITKTSTDMGPHPENEARHGGWLCVWCRLAGWEAGYHGTLPSHTCQVGCTLPTYLEL